MPEYGCDYERDYDDEYEYEYYDYHCGGACDELKTSHPAALSSQFPNSRFPYEFQILTRIPNSTQIVESAKQVVVAWTFSARIWPD